MDEKYEYMFLMYLYKVLGLKNYEKILSDRKIESLGFNTYEDLFRYFSLLSKGDTEMFNDAEKSELEFLSCYNLRELIADNALRNRYEAFINSTYKKYFFSNITGKDYVYYGPVSYEYMVPDDAICLGLNYKRFGNLSEDVPYEKIMEEQDEVICEVINDIQFKTAKEVGMKVAVVKKDERVLLNNDFLGL